MSVYQGEDEVPLVTVWYDETLPQLMEDFVNECARDADIPRAPRTIETSTQYRVQQIQRALQLSQGQLRLDITGKGHQQMVWWGVRLDIPPEVSFLIGRKGNPPPHNPAYWSVRGGRLTVSGNGTYHSFGTSQGNVPKILDAYNKIMKMIECSSPEQAAAMLKKCP